MWTCGHFELLSPSGRRFLLVACSLATGEPHAESQHQEVVSGGWGPNTGRGLCPSVQGLAGLEAVLWAGWPPSALPATTASLGVLVSRALARLEAPFVLCGLGGVALRAASVPHLRHPGGCLAWFTGSAPAELECGLLLGGWSEEASQAGRQRVPGQGCAELSVDRRPELAGRGPVWTLAGKGRRGVWAWRLPV